MTISRNISVMAQGASSSGILSPPYGGSTVWQAVQTANFAAVAGNAYPVNTTSGAVTVTLPASPFAGQTIQVTDYLGTFATNNCILNPNANKINTRTTNFALNIAHESAAFVYVDSTVGWIFYSGLQFNSLNYAASYLIIAGGGGGGSSGGGAGGGGYLAGSSNLVYGITYTITVGAGGAGGAAGAPNNGVKGNNSVALGLTSIGGGYGGGEGFSGGAGGSGGGAGRSPSALSGGAATSGQGNAGAANSTAYVYPAGGGGGAGAVGQFPPGSNQSGAGGAGSASTITGSSVTYAGGGGGAGNPAATLNQGAGGAGGGGAGGYGATGVAATANTGSGGGAGGSNGGVYYAGGAGGSGVVIISIATVNYTGVTTGSPTVTVSGLSTILKFTTSGSYTA